MNYWFMGYDQGGKALDGSRLPIWIEGYVFPEFTKAYNNWELNPWGNDLSLWYQNAKDELWFINRAKQFNLDFFVQGMGFIVSEKFVDAVSELWLDPYKLCKLNVVNSKGENNSTQKMYYYIPKYVKEDVIDFSNIIEDGVYHRELLGKTEIYIAENGKKNILRSLTIPLKTELGNFFRNGDGCLKDTIICSDNFRQRCVDFCLRGPRFDSVNDGLIIDFRLVSHGDFFKVVKTGYGYSNSKKDRQKMDTFKVKWPDPPV